MNGGQRSTEHLDVRYKKQGLGGNRGMSWRFSRNTVSYVNGEFDFYGSHRLSSNE